MHQTAATHATHDELLLARLYGGDVDEGEKGRALDQMASCGECADFFADLGAIAAATAALPTAPRPRDFKLTEADAARLGRRSVVWSIFDRLGRTKALGGSLIAAGLVGVAFVGAISVFAPAGGGGGGTRLTAVAAPVSGASASGYELNGAGQKNGADTAAATIGSNAVPAASAAATGQPPQLAATAGDQGPAVVPTAQPAGSGETAFGPAADGQASLVAAPSAVPPTVSVGDTLPGNGPGPREVALAAFAGIGILGVLLLTVPRLASRRRGR